MSKTNNFGTDNCAVLEKEIDLIQSCINRMAQNSFIIKGWQAALVTVVLTISPESSVIRVCLISLASTLCLWYLDAFFVRLERLYRHKYEWVIKNRYNSFENMYDLNPYNKSMWIHDEQNVPNVFFVMFSRTLFPFYGVFVVIIIAIIIYHYL